MSSRIDAILPEKLNEGGIRAFFTTKNPSFRSENAIIQGLNLGLNTQEAEEKIGQNRRYLAKALGIEEKNLAYAKQVHKTHVAVVKKGGLYPDMDAMVSNTPGIALGIQVADCAALLLADPINKVIGAVHAGWRGAVGNIFPETLSEMMALGAEPEHIRAFISPCLSEKSFESGEEVAVRFPDHFVNRRDYDKPHIDLKGFIEWQMMEAGIPLEQIQKHPGCTLLEDQFYSYRREKEKSGRMMAIITLDS